MLVVLPGEIGKTRPGDDESDGPLSRSSSSQSESSSSQDSLGLGDGDPDSPNDEDFSLLKACSDQAEAATEEGEVAQASKAGRKEERGEYFGTTHETKHTPHPTHGRRHSKLEKIRLSIRERAKLDADARRASYPTVSSEEATEASAADESRKITSLQRENERLSDGLGRASAEAQRLRRESAVGRCTRRIVRNQRVGLRRAFGVWKGEVPRSRLSHCLLLQSEKVARAVCRYRMRWRTRAILYAWRVEAIKGRATGSKGEVVAVEAAKDVELVHGVPSEEADSAVLPLETEEEQAPLEKASGAQERDAEEEHWVVELVTKRLLRAERRNEELERALDEAKRMALQHTKVEEQLRADALRLKSMVIDSVETAIQKAADTVLARPGHRDLPASAQKSGVSNVAPFASPGVIYPPCPPPATAHPAIAPSPPLRPERSSIAAQMLSQSLKKVFVRYSTPADSESRRRVSSAPLLSEDEDASSFEYRFMKSRHWEAFAFDAGLLHSGHFGLADVHLAVAAVVGEGPHSTAVTLSDFRAILAQIAEAKFSCADRQHGGEGGGSPSQRTPLHMLLLEHVLPLSHDASSRMMAEHEGEGSSVGGGAQVPPAAPVSVAVAAAGGGERGRPEMLLTRPTAKLPKPKQGASTGTGSEREAKLLRHPRRLSQELSVHPQQQQRRQEQQRPDEGTRKRQRPQREERLLTRPPQQGQQGREMVQSLLMRQDSSMAAGEEELLALIGEPRVQCLFSVYRKGLLVCYSKFAVRRSKLNSTTGAATSRLFLSLSLEAFLRLAKEVRLVPTLVSVAAATGRYKAASRFGHAVSSGAAAEEDEEQRQQGQTPLSFHAFTSCLGLCALDVFGDDKYSGWTVREKVLTLLSRLHTCHLFPRGVLPPIMYLGEDKEEMLWGIFETYASTPSSETGAYYPLQQLALSSVAFNRFCREFEVLQGGIQPAQIDITFKNVLQARQERARPAANVLRLLALLDSPLLKAGHQMKQSGGSSRGGRPKMWFEEFCSALAELARLRHPEVADADQRFDKFFAALVSTS